MSGMLKEAPSKEIVTMLNPQESNVSWFVFLFIIKTLIFLFLLFLAIPLLQDPDSWPLIFIINFFTHEIGHVLFRVFGNFLYVLGGNLFESLVPLVLASISFYFRKWVVGALFFFWFGQTLLDASIYMGDARARALPLVNVIGVSQTTKEGHDWYYLFSEMNLLPRDTEISYWVRLLGDSVLVWSLVIVFLAMVFSLVNIFKSRKKQKEILAYQKDKQIITNDLLLPQVQSKKV